MSGPAAASKPAFVPGFEEDLFISYGHYDNAAPTLGWISHLHDQLEGRLRQLLGTDVRFWRDRKLDGVDDFEEVLRHKVSHSALFLSILSPRYVTSESCRSEVNWFLEAARKNGGIHVESKSRMIRVLKTPLQGASELGLGAIETLGFRFYQEEPDFYEFPANPMFPGYVDFQQQSERLARAINHLLRRMREERQATSPRVARPKTVFIAECTRDVKQFRDAIRNELSDRGHRVLPEHTLETDCADDLRSSLESMLSLCDASVHLFGRLYGVVPEGEETRSVASIQYGWIRDNCCRVGFRQLLWIPEDQALPDARQQEFLRTVEEMKDHAGCPGIELFKTGLAAFKEGLLDLLAIEARPDEPVPTRSKSIYLLCDQRDLTHPEFQAIRGYLLNQGYPVDLPAFEGDPGELRDAEKMSVSDSDAAMIYYGQASDVWVKLKRKAILTALAETGKRNTRALYLSSPDSNVKKGVYLIPGGALPELGGRAPLLVLGDCGPFQADKIQPLLQRLESED
jgi:hypothetical protein